MRRENLFLGVLSLLFCFAAGAQEVYEDTYQEDQSVTDQEAQTMRESSEKVRKDVGEKGLRVSLAPVFSITRPDADVAGSSATIDTDTGMGFSALFETALKEDLDLEIGATLNRRKFQARSGQSLVEQEVNTLQFPILARMPVGKYFSLGAGPYVGVRVGPVEEKTLIGPTASIASSIEDDVEVGVMGSAAFRYGFNDWLGGFLDARYSINFSQTQDFVGMAGLAFKM